MLQKKIKKLIKIFEEQFFNPQILPQIAINVVQLEKTCSLINFCSCIKLYDHQKIAKQFFFLKQFLNYSNKEERSQRVEYQIFIIFERRLNDLQQLIIESIKQNRQSIILYMLLDKCILTFEGTIKYILSYLGMEDNICDLIVFKEQLRNQQKSKDIPFRSKKKKTTIEQGKEKDYFTLKPFKKELLEKMNRVKESYTEISKNLIKEGRKVKLIHHHSFSNKNIDKIVDDLIEERVEKKESVKSIRSNLNNFKSSENLKPSSFNLRNNSSSRIRNIKRTTDATLRSNKFQSKIQGVESQRRFYPSSNKKAKPQNQKKEKKKKKNSISVKKINFNFLDRDIEQISQIKTVSFFFDESMHKLKAKSKRKMNKANQDSQFKTERKISNKSIGVSLKAILERSLEKKRKNGIKVDRTEDLISEKSLTTLKFVKKTQNYIQPSRKNLAKDHHQNIILNLNKKNKDDSSGKKNSFTLRAGENSHRKKPINSKNNMMSFSNQENKGNRSERMSSYMKRKVSRKDSNYAWNKIGIIRKRSRKYDTENADENIEGQNHYKNRYAFKVCLQNRAEIGQFVKFHQGIIPTGFKTSFEERESFDPLFENKQFRKMKKTTMEPINESLRHKEEKVMRRIFTEESEKLKFSRTLVSAMDRLRQKNI